MENFVSENKRRINVTRYTFDSWMKCYPKSNYDEWYEATQPDNLMDFYYNAAEKLNLDIDKDVINIVTLDDEYFKWLNGRKNTSETRTRYATSVDLKNSTKMLKKNNLDKIEDIYFIPVVFNPLSENSFINLTFSEEFANKIKTKLETLTGAQDYIPKVVISSQAICNYSEDDIDYLFENTISENEEALKKMSGRITSRPGLVSIDFIPIKVTYRVKDSCIRPDDYVDFNKRGFSIYSENWGLFSEDEIVNNDENGSLVSYNFVTDFFNIPETYDEIVKALTTALQETNEETVYYA